MITYNVNITDGASSMLRKVLSALTGPESKALNAQGARAAVNEAMAYHREFDKSGGWKGKRYLGPSDEGSHFGADVAAGWHFLEADKDGATISNGAPFYGFKVTGGTIVPKRSQYLTIPLIREARGIRARVYSQNTGHDLFTIKGKNALFERVEGSTAGARGRKKQAGGTSIKTSTIRAVYALLRSVTMGPWEGALPPENRIAGAFSSRYREALAEIIETA